MARGGNVCGGAGLAPCGVKAGVRRRRGGEGISLARGRVVAKPDVTRQAGGGGSWHGEGARRAALAGAINGTAKLDNEVAR